MESFKALFVPTTNAGVTYWRMWNFSNAIHRTGAGQSIILWYDRKQTDLSPWEGALQDAVDNDDYGVQYKITNDMWSAIRQADAVIFGMTHFQSSLDLFDSVIELRNAGNLRNVPVLMEIDDNILSVPSYNPAFASYAPGSSIRKCTERQLRLADGIIVSTSYLLEVYKEYNQNVYCLPNCIDWEKWGKLKNRPKGGVRIGWAGGSAHKEDLEIIEPVIPKILDANPTAKFVFLHGIAPFVKDLQEKYPRRIELVRSWTQIDKYPAKIASLDFDIAVAPLVDNAFNRGKSNLRWLEAAALGVPCIASNVGHFAETIESGITGILCDGPAAFETAISALIKDAGLRRRIGAAAKKTAQEKFDVNWMAQRYVDSLKQCSNIVADRQVDLAEKELAERTGKENVHDKIAVEESCLIDGRGPAADTICKPV